MYKIKRFSIDESKKNDKSKSSKATKGAAVLGGIGAIGGGAKMLDNVYKSGEMSGRVHLYHGTNTVAKESILKEGLKGSYALDPNNLTNSVMNDIGSKDGRKLVYTGKKRFPAYLMALNNKAMAGKDPAMVKMSIPYNEYKNMKRVYDNPEFKGATSADEYLKKMGVENASRTEKKGAKIYYDLFSGGKGTSGTRIFEQDIDTKRIKGSKDYVRNSLGEVAEYIKSNPKRFAKGTAKAAIGTGLVAGGGYLIHKGTTTKKGKK